MNFGIYNWSINLILGFVSIKLLQHVGFDFNILVACIWKLRVVLES